MLLLAELNILTQAQESKESAQSTLGFFSGKPDELKIKKDLLIRLKDAFTKNISRNELEKLKSNFNSIKDEKLTAYYQKVIELTPIETKPSVSIEYKRG